MHGGIGFTWGTTPTSTTGTPSAWSPPSGARDYPQRVFDTATATGMRPLDIDLDPDTEKLRSEIRAEVAALKRFRATSARAAHRRGGWVLPYLPRPWGREATPVEQIIISQEFSSGRVKRPQHGHRRMAHPSIVAFGTDEQKQRFLPPTFRGEMIWCQLFSEPGAGSDLANLTTKATKVDGGWRITGQKIWTTAAQFSQWVRCWRAPTRRPETQRHHLLPARHEAAGVEVKPLRELTGNALFNTVFIDDVFIARRAGPRPGGPGLGSQPQYPYRRTGFDRQRRTVVPAQP